MAIERMKKLTILFPASTGEAFEEWLYGKGALHLKGIEKEFTKVAGCGSRICLDGQSAAGNLAKAAELIAECDALRASRKSFIDGLFPVKRVVGEAEIEDAVAGINLKSLHAKVREKAMSLKGNAARLELLRRERAHLQKFAFLSIPLRNLKGLKDAFVLVAEGGTAFLEGLAGDEEAAELFAWEVKGREADALMLLIAGLRADEEKIPDIIRAHGGRILPFPDIECSVMDRLDEIKREEGELRHEHERLGDELRALLPAEIVPVLQCVRGYWESEVRRVENARAMLCSSMVGVARGYARARDTEKLIGEMEGRFPGVSIVVSEPEPGENVPVSIRLSRWLRPAQLLINMFGLPDYFTLDPTPFLMAVFLAFFGICFADVFYGLMLTGLSWALVRRYRRQENLREFFRLFLYCGVSTIIFGVLTGSWAADIYKPEYLGPENPLLRLVKKTTLLDLLEKPVIALIAALGIGVATQFYGIVLKIIQGLKMRSWQTAVYDGVFWLAYLGGLLTFSLCLVFDRGGPPRIVGLGFLSSGAVGLVLTQGRDQKGWGARLVAGVVSLYGVMGTYGTTSFAGDVISYSRLLALGLTTYVVGMSFNIIAGLASAPLGSVPVLSVLVFLVVAIPGHLFNFIISALSGFVHSARLILLEFFGRFYNGGGEWFAPHGFQSETVEMVKQ